MQAFEIEMSLEVEGHCVAKLCDCFCRERREYVVNRTCMECDPECVALNETQACSGPVRLPCKQHASCVLEVPATVGVFCYCCPLSCLRDALFMAVT